jgi:thiol-disulfide isomerase/thioredoxin
MIRSFLMILGCLYFQNSLAQDVRKFHPLGNLDLCPYFDSTVAGSAVGIEMKISRPHLFDSKISANERKLCSEFGTYAQNGKLETIADHSGSIVVIGFWSTRCPASFKMLEDLKNQKLQVVDKHLNIIFWPVHFQNWAETSAFTSRNSKLLEGLEFKKVGIGKNGLSNLIDTLEGLPTIFIIDKNGRIVSTWAGYHPGLLTNQLNLLIKE